MVAPTNSVMYTEKMALVIPVGYAQIAVAMRHVSQSRTAVVTFGVEWSVDIAFPSQRCDDILAAFVDGYGPYIDAGVDVGPVSATIGAEGGENVTVVGTDHYAPPNQLEVEPSNVALLVRKSTARGGRRGRGRFYIPWIVPNAAVDDVGQLSGEFHGNMQVASNDLLSNLAAAQPGGAGTPMVLLHSTSPNSATGSPNPVVGLTVDTLVGTQRRRLGR